MRKVNRNRTGNKSRLYYIFGIVAICAFVSIGIGYSILTSTVRIDGTASITSTWKIVFTKAVENTMNEATTTSGPSITAGTTLDIGVELNKKGSQAIYDVTVQNQGTIDAVVKEIRLNDGEPTDLKVYISGLYKGFALKAGESKQFQVIAEWSASAPESSETEKNVNVSVDFEQETEGGEKPELSMPTYTVDYPNEVWTKEKNVTMTYPEGENLLYQYSTDGGKTWLIAPSRVYVLKFTTEGTLYIRVSDGVSVLTTPLITIDKIDGTVPDVQVNGNDSEWTTSKTLTINASDKESGLATNPYSWDGGNSWTSVKEKEFTSNQTVNIWVKDNAGNINKQSVTISKIDNQAPTNVTLKEGLITSSSISVTANATQTGGGIKGYQFSINNGAWSSEQTSATKTFTGLTKNTSYTIKVRVIANNGKYTDSSNITIKTNDITVPTYSVVDDGPNFTKEVTINYPDVKTINLVYEYSTDGGKSWMAIGGTTTTITFTEDGSVIARVRDTGNNNNTVTASTLTIQFPINMLIDGLRLGSIEHIEFVNYLAPDGTEFIDVSKEQNESIQLWTDSTGKSYIGSTKKIYGNTDSSWLFSSFETYLLEAITFNDYFDTSKVTNMSYMFADVGRNGKLVNLDLSTWDTSNVTDMNHMFYFMIGLTNLNVSNWNTSKVTDMSYTFAGLQRLTSLDISNWDTSKVTKSTDMFQSSNVLSRIKVGTKVGTNALSKLPQQSSSNIPGADGKWYSETTGTGYLPSNIPGNKADTYTAISPKPDFTTDSWDKIVSNIRAGKSSVYEVGDTKEIELTGDYAGTYTLRLANTSTPVECAGTDFSQSACGFVVEFEDIITYEKINSSDTNKDGWPGSELYQKLNPKNGDTTNSVIYNALPEELKEVIIDTKVISSYGSNDSTNFTSIDKLYLLATKEIWGKDGTSNTIYNDTSDNQTRQLDYYKSIGITTNNYSGASKQYRGVNASWWTRSALSTGSNRFYRVDSIGDWGNFIAYATSGVAPAFRIG